MRFIRLPADNISGRAACVSFARLVGWRRRDLQLNDERHLGLAANLAHGLEVLFLERRERNMEAGI